MPPRSKNGAAVTKTVVKSRKSGVNTDIKAAETPLTDNNQLAATPKRGRRAAATTIALDSLTPQPRKNSDDRFDHD